MPRRYDPLAAAARKERAVHRIAEDAEAREVLRARIDKMIHTLVMTGEAPAGHPGYADLAHQDRQAGIVRPHPRPGLDLLLGRVRG